MNWEQMKEAVKDAEQTIRSCDRMVDSLAEMLIGRLRKVWDTDTLKQLKHELRDFDSRSGLWRDQ
jgi:hypothetical protein